MLPMDAFADGRLDEAEAAMVVSVWNTIPSPVAAPLFVSLSVPISELESERYAVAVTTSLIVRVVVSVTEVVLVVMSVTVAIAAFTDGEDMRPLLEDGAS